MYSDLKSLMKAIADAIRTKDGTSDLIPTQDIPERILNIPSGGGGGTPEEIYSFSDFGSGKFTMEESIEIPRDGKAIIFTCAMVDECYGKLNNSFLSINNYNDTYFDYCSGFVDVAAGDIINLDYYKTTGKWLIRAYVYMI